MHRLILRKIDFPDETLYPAVDRYDVLTHLCIVRKLHVSPMDKTGADPTESQKQHDNNRDIKRQFFSFLIHND